MKGLEVSKERQCRHSLSLPEHQLQECCLSQYTSISQADIIKYEGPLNPGAHTVRERQAVSWTE